MGSYCFCERNSLSGSIMDTSGFLLPPVNNIISSKARMQIQNEPVYLLIVDRMQRQAWARLGEKQKMRHFASVARWAPTVDPSLLHFACSAPGGAVPHCSRRDSAMTPADTLGALAIQKCVPGPPLWPNYATTGVWTLQEVLRIQKVSYILASKRKIQNLTRSDRCYQASSNLCWQQLSSTDLTLGILPPGAAPLSDTLWRDPSGAGALLSLLAVRGSPKRWAKVSGPDELGLDQFVLSANFGNLSHHVLRRKVWHLWYWQRGREAGERQAGEAGCWTAGLDVSTWGSDRQMLLARWCRMSHLRGRWRISWQKDIKPRSEQNRAATWNLLPVSLSRRREQHSRGHTWLHWLRFSFPNCCWLAT